MNFSPNTIKPSTVGRSITGAVAILAVSNLASKILALVRMRVLAEHGGVDANVDAYAFSFLVPELLNHFLAAGMLSITFIPLFQKHIARGNRDRAWDMFSNLLTIGTAACLVFIAFGMIFANPVVRLLGGVNIDNPDNPAQLALTVQLTRIILPAQICFFWGALLMGVQYAHKKFLFPALSGVIYNAGIILGGVVLAPRLGIQGFSWGVLLGALAGNVGIQLYGAIRAGMRFKFRFNLKDPDLKEYLLLTIPLILGLNLSFSNEFLFRFFGSRIPGGEGAIASLEYSWRLMFMIVGVFGQSLAAGFYPFVSQMAVEKKYREIHEMMNTILVKMGAVLGPVSGIAAILSFAMVTILLRTGRFDANSVALTAGPLAMYLAGTWFYAATPLIYRLFYARGNTVFPLIVNTGTVIACIPLYIFAAEKYGSAGIAFASSASMILQFIVIYALYCKIHANPFWKSTVSRIAVLAGISLGAAALSSILLPYARKISWAVNFGPFVTSIAEVLIAGLPSFAAAVLSVHFLKIVNITELLNLVLGRLKLKSGRKRSMPV